MGFRQQLHRNSVGIAGVACLIVIAATYILVFGLKPGSHPDIPVSAFYSDDDGKTWFVDSINRIPPFDHNGKEAVRAILFRSGNGKPFVQRLEKFTPDAKLKMEQAAGTKVNPLPSVRGITVGTLLKKPGDKQWREVTTDDISSGAIITLMQPVNPDGTSDSLQQVLPENIDQ